MMSCEFIPRVASREQTKSYDVSHRREPVDETILNPFTVEKDRLGGSKEIYQFYIKHRTKRHATQLQSLSSSSVVTDEILAATLRQGTPFETELT
jgi:hypothetical protein